MAQSLSGLELYYITRELQEITDARIDKIYLDDTLFSIKMHKTAMGSFFLHYHLPSLLYISTEKTIDVKDLPHFAAYLRKYITNARIKEITQLSKRERIINITLEKDKVYHLIIELLPPGNLILCDENMLILSPYKPRKFSSRTVRAKAPYEMDIRPDVDEAGFIEILKTSKKNLVKTLAIDMGLSGTYAEELCTRQQLQADMLPAQCSDEECKALYKAYGQLFNLPIAPSTDGKKVYPFALLSKQTNPVEGTYSQLLASTISIEHEEKPDPRLVKKQAIIDQQEEDIKRLAGEIEENQAKGEAIYHHYMEIAAFLEDKNNPPTFVKGIKDRKADLEFD